MLRALLAGSFVAILLGWLGTFMVTRKMSFMGDGIAHSSLAGIALALLVGWAPIPTAVILAIGIAIGIYILENKTNITSDMAIGMMLATGMAIGIILLNFYPGYQPELISFLFGNILTINTQDLQLTLGIGSIILFILAFYYHKLVFTTFDREGAYLSGLNPWKYDILLYVMSAIGIVLSIKLVGIILVSALIITPSAFSRIFAKSFRQFTFIAIISAIIIVISGLVISYYLNIPSGATIIIVGTTLFILGSILQSLSKHLHVRK